jgi:hypothetical protein
MVRFHYSCVLLWAAGTASGQQWTVVRLHPGGATGSMVRAVSAGVQGGNSYNVQTGKGHAVLWFGSAANWLSLSSDTAEVDGIWGVTQVGAIAGRASLWAGTPESRVDLHPADASGSYALAMRGDVQAGVIWLGFNGIHHAALWRGTGATFLDLNPIGATHSYAYATDGVLQGGYVLVAAGRHAALWSGTSQSFVDMSPPGSGISYIRGMAPGVQVGEASFGTASHAVLWRGTPGSWTDLHPPGWGGTRLFATTGRVHVGYGGISGPEHAIVNFGTPDSWIDLHQYLPPGYGSFSGANAVYQDGNAVYVGGYAVRDGATDEAILWIGTLPCYANCDQSTIAPALNVLDFNCFINRFVAADPYANCDASTAAPVLNALDFNCFLNRFATGCP